MDFPPLAFLLALQSMLEWR